MGFCNQCGNKLFDYEQTCPYCGAVQPKLESQPVAPEQTQAVFEQTQAVFEQTPVVQKAPIKSKRGLIIGITSCAAVAAVAVLLLIIINPFSSKEKEKPMRQMYEQAIDYYQAVEAVNKQETTKKIGSTYKEIQAVGEMLSYAQGLDLEVEFAPSLFEGQDIFNIKSVGADTKLMYKKDEGINLNLAASLNGKTYLSPEISYDASKKLLLARIPEISEEYFYLDLQEVVEELSQNMNALVQEIPQISITEEEIVAFVDKYIDMIVAATEKVTEEKDATLTVGKLSGTYTKITSTLSEAKTLDLTKKILEELKNENLVISLADSFGYTKEQYQKEIDDLLINLNEEKVDENDNDFITITVYIDSKDNIIAREIEFETTKLLYATIETDTNIATRIAVIENDNELEAELLSEATIKDGKRTGTVTLSDDTDSIVIEYKDFLIERKDDKVIINGTVSLDLGLVDDELTGSIVKVIMTGDKNEQTVQFAYEQAGVDLIKATAKAYGVNISDFNIPTVDLSKAYNLSNEADIERYLSNNETKLKELAEKLITDLGIDFESLIDDLLTNNIKNNMYDDDFFDDDDMFDDDDFFDDDDMFDDDDFFDDDDMFDDDDFFDDDDKFDDDDFFDDDDMFDDDDDDADDLFDDLF